MAKLSRSGAILSLLVVVVAAMAAGVVLLGKGRAPGAGGQVGAGDWPTYMYDGARSGFNRQETLLSPDNAANLRLLWKRKLGNVLAGQPIVEGDTVYEGAWDGFLYALSTKDGAVRWKTDLGRTTSDQCVPKTAGITSAAAVAGGMLYIGGGDDQLYALNPATGEVAWKFKTGDNSPEGGAYNWTSPLVYNGRVYYGTAAFCDKPFTQARLWGVNAGTGKAEQEAQFVPGDQRGGGIWTAPTVDEATGEFYVTVGSGDYYIPHNYSIARLDPRSLATVDAWQIPSDEQVFDGDWGTTPTLFRDKAGTLMVGAAAKNGYYYAFRAGNIAAGSVWRTRIADGGECPQCGDGSIASSAYAYNTVFVAGGYQSLGLTQKLGGTVRALDPTTGATRWIHAATGAVMPALAVANGLVVAGADDTVEVLSAATGDLLWEYATEGQLYAAPSIAGGVVYAASTDGYVYAFSAGPYAEGSQAYKVGQVGAEPPPFSAFRKPVEAPRLPGEEQCFADTGKCARGDFLAFWRAHGGIERFGPAVTGELNEAGRTVQYFRNAPLDLHPKPDGQGTEARYGKLDFRLAYYRPEDDNFKPAQPISGATFIPETHHNLAEPFLSYWRSHGDVPELGYPVSEPFDEANAIDGQTRRVQYFERSRLELVKAQDGSEQVVPGALGLSKYRQRYGKLP